jgi:hypothetical protein
MTATKQATFDAGSGLAKLVSANVHQASAGQKPTDSNRLDPEQTDSGQILLLGLVYFMLAVVLIAAVAGASAVHLQRKQLLTFADQAALAAADAADIAAYYTGDTIAPGLVLLSEETADAAVAEFVAANSCLITDFADFYVDDVTTDGRTVTVTFGARAYLPILTPFLEIWSDGIGLVVTSSARAW